MPRATIEQKDRVIKILKVSFQDNPSIVEIVNQNKPIDRQLDLLLSYAYQRAYNRGGVYISQNEKGAALCFSSEEKGIFPRELIAELKFGLAVSLLKSLKTLSRQKRLSRIRVKEPHLYFWFFGAMKENNGGAYELMHELFEKSAECNLPIVAETSVEKNRRVYERFGFKVYHVFEDNKGPRLYMMIRQPLVK
ncbi:MAG: hypothetical protein ACO2Z9_00225 [Crocinitomicaceae bacterium]